MLRPIKPAYWIGSSKKDLLALPADVIDEFGYGLHLAQTGRRHSSAKTLRGFGSAGVVELVESREGNAYRAVYAVEFAEAVFVLHVFQKKSTQGAKTPKPDIELIHARIKLAQTLAKELKS